MNTDPEPAAVVVPAITIADHACQVVHVRAARVASAGAITWHGLLALTDTRDRVRAAVAGSGYRWPDTGIAVNVVPDLREPDPGLDLPVAVALLAAAGQVPATDVAGIVCLGELGPDGRVHTPWRLADRLDCAGQTGLRCVLAPPDAAFFDPEGVRVWEVADLRVLADRLTGRGRLLGEPEVPAIPAIDLAALPAHYAQARRALQVAAAGGHHLAVATTMLYERTLLGQLLAGLLPDLDPATSAQLTRLYLQAGLLPRLHPTRPPWQPVTYRITVPDLIGSLHRGPGLASLAHTGLMLLDEQPTTAGGVVGALCRILDHQQVTIAGGAHQATYPAALQLILGIDRYCHHLAGRCNCPPHLDSYTTARLPRLRPLLDRIDIHLTLPAPPSTRRPLRQPAEPSHVVATRIARARTAAATRWADQGAATNSQADPTAIDRLLSRHGWQDQLDRAVQVGALSARGVACVKRLAVSIADLAGRDTVTPTDLEEAFRLRTGHDLPGHWR